MASTTRSSTRTWRQLAVWMHVLTSVAWMALAMTLTTVLTFAVAEPEHSAAILATAHHLDTILLAALANGSALTGIVLSAMTAFGFFHHWWVATKFAITLVQLYLGIFVLSDALDAAAAADGPAGGRGRPARPGPGLHLVSRKSSGSPLTGTGVVSG